jgi:hypothetical protein
MAVDHRLLDRVQATAFVAQMLHGDHLGAADLRQKQDAGVHLAVPDRTVVQRAEHDRAGAAVALGAALLGASAPLNLAQILQKRHGRVDIRDRPLLVTH